MDWNSAVERAIERLNKTGLESPFQHSAALVDYMASRKIVPKSDLIAEAVKINSLADADLVSSILANVTVAVHGKGSVPDPGGWYFRDDTLGMYVLDRWFSAAWREARLAQNSN